MSRLLDFVLKNRVLVFVLFAALAGGGIFALYNVPIDALPDLGENQVIVFTDWPGRTPKDVENQITFPLSTTLQGISGVKDIRAQSGFGFSMIYVIFRDNVDFYFARTRVLEKLNSVGNILPPGVVPTLGPDGSGLGQIFWYTVEGEGQDLQELRSIQDWYVRYGLASVEGVSEVASVGGFVKQYQINVDASKVFSYNLKNSDIVMAVQNSNKDIGAKVLELNGMEYLIRGAGFIKSTADIEQIVIGEKDGIPLRIKDIAQVTLGPDFRRGVLNKDGKEAVGGVVIMRYRDNPGTIIERIKKKIVEISPGLPEGVSIVPFYDRTHLIEETTGTLKESILVELLITMAVILAFALPFSHSIIISLSLPMSVLMTFLFMYLFKVDVHIMSLTGIIIAIGTIVDMAIVISENIYRNMNQAGDPHKLSLDQTRKVIHKGALEVAKAVAGAVATTVVPFLAILVLDGQSAKLFHPVVYTKTFLLIGSLVTAIFLLPPLYLEFHLWERKIANFKWKSTQGRIFKAVGIVGMVSGLVYLSILIFSLQQNQSTTPAQMIGQWVLDNKLMLGFSLIFLLLVWILAKYAQKIIRVVIPWALKNKWILVVPLALFAFAVYIMGFRIQNEFRPPLDEGAFLFMPVLLPSASLTQVNEVLEQQNKILKTFPEVEHAVGKLGRIESATDPADITMIETIVALKPKSQWRPGVTMESLKKEMDEVLGIPGVGNIWTQPIQNRVDMLSTGIRTAVGIKVFGKDLAEIEKLSLKIDQAIQNVDGLQSSYVERVMGKPYIEFILNRESIAWFGMSVFAVQEILETALGGENLTTVYEERERYPVRMRYQRDQRDSLEGLSNLLVVAPNGARIPISRLAEIRLSLGPSMINSENGQLRGVIYINLNQDIGPLEFVNAAQVAINEKLTMPKGYYFEFAGDFQNQIRANELLKWILPLCLFAIFVILYLSFGSLSQTVVVFLAIPVSLSGGILMLYFLGFKMSIAVVVGFIALFGVAVDDGIILTSYINQMKKGRVFNSIQEIRDMVTNASAQRIRPLLMTSTTSILALVPVLWATGRGSEIIRPMSIPSIGGMIMVLITIVIVPILNSWLLERSFKKALFRGLELVGERGCK